MKKMKWMGALGALFLGSCVGHAQVVGYVPGRILVKPKAGFTVEDAVRPFSGQSEGEIPGLRVKVVRVPEHAYEQALQGLRRNPNIEFAEPDAIMSAGATANDTYFNSAWHLPKIQAPSAWDVTTGSSNVIVAVLDTGLDANHPDFAGRLVPGWNAYSGNTDTTDVTGHGTGVAGAVGAASNNGLGVTGVTWNCRIMPVRISDASGYALWSTTASALTWAADHGARVANISFVGVSSSASVQSAAQYMQSKGGVVAACSGNSALADTAPDNPYVLTVSATTPSDLLASFSNYGSNIDLSAPGTNIWSTVRGGGYGAWWGTSLAAPQVAGAAALVISINPALSGAQVQEIVKNSTDDLGATGWDNRFGKGRLNVQRAVTTAQNTSAAPAPGPGPAPVADNTAPSIAITSPTAGTTVRTSLSVLSNASDNVGVTKVELYVNGKLTSTSTTAPFTTSWNTRKAAVGNHNLQTKALDAAGNSAWSQVVTVKK